MNMVHNTNGAFIGIEHEHNNDTISYGNGNRAEQL